MDIYGCGYVFVVALAPYRPWFPSYNGFADFGKQNIKGYGPEKVEGFPGRIRLAKSMPMWVFFPHRRFHGKSGSYGLSKHIIDICRRCTMHGIWKKRPDELRKIHQVVFHEYINNRYVCELVP